MLLGLRQKLREYDTFPLTLVFERAGRVEVEVLVEEAATMEPKHDLPSQ
jgi:copper(I)-binding protein